MEGIGWIAAIIVGGLAGWIASSIMKTNTGIFANILIGILGAIVLNAILFVIVGGTWGGWIGQLIIGIIGACLLVWLFRAFSSRRA